MLRGQRHSRIAPSRGRIAVSPWRQSVEWISALIRSVGTAFPATAFLVQLNSEIQADKVNQRLDHLEDPISSLHPDVEALSLKIYSALKGGASTHLAYEDGFYEQFSRPLAALEARGYIKGGHATGKRYAFGLN